MLLNLITFLVGALWVVVCIGGTVVVVVVGAIAFFRGRTIQLSPGAEFAGEKALQAAGVLTDHPELESGCVVLGAAYGEYAVVQPEGDRPAPHTLLVGPPATGKSSTMRAALLCWPHAAVVVDPIRPGSDHYSGTAGFRASIGPVYVVDLSGGPGHRFDPLADARTASWAESAAATLLDADRNGAGYDAYVEKARVMLTAALRASELAGASRLPFVADVFAKGLTSGTRAVQAVDAGLAESMGTGHGRAETFLYGAWDTTRTRLAPLFAPQVLQVLSGSDFDPAALRASNATVYVRVAEEDLPALRPVVSLVISSLIRSLALSNAYAGNTLSSARSDSTVSSSNVLVVLDEAGTIRPPDLPDLSAWVGSRGITLLLAVQSLAQLRDAYGVDRANKLLANLGARVTYRPADTVSALELERSIGDASTVHQNASVAHTGWFSAVPSEGWSETKQPLLPAYVARQLDSRNVVISLPGLPHVLGWRVGPCDLPGWRGRWNRPTPVLPEPPARSEAAPVPSLKPTALAAVDPGYLPGTYVSEIEKVPAIPGTFDQLPGDFLSRVDRSGECWLWTGATVKGYGVYGTKKRYAHRVVFEHCIRPLLSGEEVDHTCQTILCVRPDHLDAVTPAENKARHHERRRAKTEHVRKLINDALQ